MKFPFRPKISLHDRHRENLVWYFLVIGTPLILAFAIFEWMGQRYDEAILDLSVLVVFFIAAVFRKRVEDPQNTYRIVMTALGLNFLYVLYTNQGIIPAIFWQLALPLPAVILLGVREGLIWIIVTGISIIGILSTPAKAAYVSTENIVIFMVIYFTVGIFSIFSEYVRHQTARMLASQQSNLEALNLTIMEKALEDPLTHTFNRSYLSEVMPDKVSRAIQLSKPLSIIIMDIDQFKGVNDTYGHDIGDVVLVQTANTFQQQLRGQYDDVVRLGGDEFMVVLPDTLLEHSVPLAERLRVSVQDMRIPGEDFHVTCSMGVVALEGEEYKLPANQSIRRLIKRGDRCMYQAKRLGKNLVVPNCEGSEEE
ncbi:MAG: diguanylate cyclase [Anaerolineales bacterium]